MKTGFLYVAIFLGALMLLAFLAGFSGAMPSIAGWLPSTLVILLPAAFLLGFWRQYRAANPALLTSGGESRTSSVPQSDAPAPARPKHRFHNAVIVVTFVAALFVFALFAALPSLLGLNRFLSEFHPGQVRSPSHDGFRLFLGLFMQVILPFWISNRFFRFVLQIAGRRLYGSGSVG